MKWYWPEMTDLESAESAAHAGAGACFFVAAVTSLVAVISISLSRPIMGLNGWSFVDASLFAIAGWRMWRFSRPWAIVALAMYLLERVYAAISNPGASMAIVMTVILTLLLIGGIRGTFAYHRFKKAGEQDMIQAASHNPDFTAGLEQ